MYEREKSQDVDEVSTNNDHACLPYRLGWMGMRSVGAGAVSHCWARTNESAMVACLVFASDKMVVQKWNTVGRDFFSLF